MGERSAVKQPLVWLLVLGAALALFGMHLSAVVVGAVSQIGTADR